MITPREILNRFQDFDHLPVCEDGKIVGVLYRRDVDTGSQTLTVRECMQKLSEHHLVSAEQPLLPFLEVLLEEPDFRLVVMGTRIAGIVTRSDVLNLPVRLLGFALSMQLEAVITAMITARCQDENEWIALLPEKAQATLLANLEKLTANRANPAAIEAVTFAQKIALGTDLHDLGDAFKHEHERSASHAQSGRPRPQRGEPSLSRSIREAAQTRTALDSGTVIEVPNIVTIQRKRTHRSRPAPRRDHRSVRA